MTGTRYINPFETACPALFLLFSGLSPHLLTIGHTMKKLSITLLFLVALMGNLLAQQAPVKYTWTVKALTDNTYEITFKAKVEQGWYTYSQYLESDLGPIPTSVNFESSEVQKLGKATETTSASANKVEGYDDLFDMNITKYKKDLTIKQKFQVSNPTQPVAGYLEYMTCNDSQCLPPTSVEFSFLPSSYLPKPGTPPPPKEDPTPKKDPAPKEQPTDNSTGQTTPNKANQAILPPTSLLPRQKHRLPTTQKSQ